MAQIQNREISPVAIAPASWKPEIRVRKTKGKTVVHATCPDGVRRQVKPFVSHGHLGISTTSQETQHHVVAYPIENIWSPEGRLIMRTLMRMVASGEMTVASDYRQWPDETAVVRDAISFVMGRRGGYAFDVTQYPEYKQFIGRPTRRGRLVNEMQMDVVPMVPESRIAAAY